MSIHSKCLECGATDDNGALTHGKSCTLAPQEISYGKPAPTIQLTFDTPEEQEKFHSGLTSNGGTVMGMDYAKGSDKTVISCRPHGAPQIIPSNNWRADLIKNIQECPIETGMTFTEFILSQNTHTIGYMTDANLIKAIKNIRETE